MTPVKAVMAEYRDNVLSVIRVLYLDNKVNSNELLNIIESSNEHQLFGIEKTNSLHDVISHIHSCLSTAKQRLEGLVLLKTVVQQCSTSVFSRHVNTWLKLLAQIIQSPGPAPLRGVACVIIGEIFVTVKNFPEVSREVSTSIVPQLLPALLASSAEWQRSALSCINSCLQHFGSSCGPFKTKIEDFIVNILDYPQACKEAVRCFALLAAAGGSGSQGAKYSAAWSEQCFKLISVLHPTIAELYQNCETGDYQRKISAKLSIREVPANRPEALVFLLERYKTFSECLCILLSESFPAIARVPISDILQLTFRGFSVTGKLLNSKLSNDRLLLLGNLPVIQRSTYDILTSLIKSCKQLLMPYSDTITRQFLRTLAWTKSGTSLYGQEKPYSHLRQSVYECLLTWLQVMGTSCNISGDSADLVNELIADIRPEVDAIKIDTKKTKSADISEAPPAKKKRKHHGYQDITSHGISTQRKIDRLANADLTHAALQVLRWLLTTTGSMLAANTFQSVQSALIRLIMEVQQNPSSPPIPYGDPHCRRAAYASLQTLMLVPHPTSPASLQMAGQLLRAGTQDSNLEVASQCTEAVAVLECIIHPRVPCFLKPITDLQPPENKNMESSSERLDIFNTNSSSITTPNWSRTVHNTENISSLGKKSSTQLVTNPSVSSNETLLSDIGIENSVKSTETVLMETENSNEFVLNNALESDEAIDADTGDPRVIGQQSAASRDELASSESNVTDDYVITDTMTDGKSNVAEAGKATHSHGVDEELVIPGTSSQSISEMPRTSSQSPIGESDDDEDEQIQMMLADFCPGDPD